MPTRPCRTNWALWPFESLVSWTAWTTRRACCPNRSPAGVVVVGGAGIGKTTLVRQLAAAAADEQIHQDSVRALATHGQNRLPDTFQATVFGGKNGATSTFALGLGDKGHCGIGELRSQQDWAPTPR